VVNPHTEEPAGLPAGPGGMGGRRRRCERRRKAPQRTQRYTEVHRGRGLGRLGPGDL